MNEFENNLKAELNTLAAEASPSPTAWEEIAFRAQTFDVEMENPMDMPNQMPTNRGRYPVLAAAAAVLVLIAAAALLLRQDEDPEGGPADRVETVETTPTTVPSPSTTSTVPEAPTVPDVEVMALGPSIGSGPSLSGVFRTEAMGFPVQFETDDDLRLTRHGPGEIELRLLTRQGRQVIEITRLSGFYDNTQSSRAEADTVGSIAPDDIDGWLADSSFIAEQDRATTVGGYPARVLDIRLDDAVRNLDSPCGSSDPDNSCRVIFSKPQPVLDRYKATFGTVPTWGLFTGEVTRLWVIDLPEGDPLLMAATSSSIGGFSTFLLQAADRLVESMSFGEPAALTLPTEAERAVALLLPEDEARGIAQQLADGLQAGDYTKMIEALGPDGRWIDLDRQEQTDGAALESLTSELNAEYSIGEVQDGLPVVGGYLFPAGRVLFDGTFDTRVSFFVTLDTDGNIMAADYYG